MPSLATFDDVESAVPYLHTLRASGARAVVVLNATKPRVNAAPEKTMLLTAAELCPIEIGDRADHNRAGAKGLSLVDLVGHPGGDEIRGLWAYVKSRLGTSVPAPAVLMVPKAPARKGKRNVQA